MPIAWSTSITTPPASSGISWGWDEALDLGTTGDYFVHAVDGDNLNAGTTAAAPFATIAHALTTVGAGNAGVIRLMGDGVKYREQISMISGQDNANRIEILAYGTNRPIWTGGEQITGFVPCVEADASIVGSNWANIYKKTGVTKTDFADDDPFNMNLFENNVQMQMCIGWTGSSLGDKFFMGNTADWYTADSVTTDGSNNIQSYNSASLTGAFSATQIENAYVYGHTSPNAAFVSSIASVSGSTITLTDQTQDYEDNGNQDRFALVNLLPTMEAGQYGFVDNGATVDVYLWPTSSANLTSGIEYCARVHCILFFNRSHWSVKGVRFQQVSGVSGTRPGAFILQPAGNVANNITLENNLFYGRFTLEGGAPGATTLWSVNNLKVHHNTIERAQNSFGFTFFGDVNSPTSETIPATDLDFQQNYVFRSSRAAFRFYTQHDAIVAHNKAEMCGLAAHANKVNFYEHCHRFLVWGNVFVDVDGYATWQKASQGHWLFNYFYATRQSVSNNSRALVDQNNTFEPPSGYLEESGETLIANNAFLPQPVAYNGTSENTLVMTTDSSVAEINSTVTFTALNNLVHGMQVRQPHLITEIAGNWNTGPDGAYNANDTAAAGADVYTAPATGDFTIKTGAAIRSASGNSLTAKITAMQVIFGDRFTNWNLDCLGNEFSAAAPPVGPVAGYDYTALQGSLPLVV